MFGAVGVLGGETPLLDLVYLTVLSLQPQWCNRVNKPVFIDDWDPVLTSFFGFPGERGWIGSDEHAGLLSDTISDYQPYAFEPLLPVTPGDAHGAG